MAAPAKKKRYDCRFLDRYMDPKQGGFACLEVYSYVDVQGHKRTDDRFAICKICRTAGKSMGQYKFGVSHGGLNDCTRHVNTDGHKDAAVSVNSGIFGPAAGIDGGMGLFPTLKELAATR